MYCHNEKKKESINTKLLENSLFLNLTVSLSDEPEVSKLAKILKCYFLNEQSQLGISTTDSNVRVASYSITTTPQESTSVNIFSSNARTWGFPPKTQQFEGL